ncbi:MAG: septum formation initiator family protein [Clostridiales bacterium]|jgi:cell division protein FtsB|nr:septum formation initiator family protein [Clostridiales bacterium]
MKKRASKKKAPQRQFNSFILTVAIVAVFGYFIMTFIQLRIDIKERKSEITRLQAEYNQKLAENEQIQGIIDNGDESDYFEIIARQQHGYIMPDERVYYDATPGVY